VARSAKKGPYVDLRLLDKVSEVKKTGKREHVKTWKRSCVIVPEFVGSYFSVHNGKDFISFYVTENMVGHKLGEFSPTRTFRMHSGQRKAAGKGNDQK